MVFRVDIVQCRGTPREVGLAQAKLFATTSKGRAFIRRKTDRLPWWFNLDTEKRTFARDWPMASACRSSERCFASATVASVRRSAAARQ
jgi:hypothetical protein